MTLIRSIVAVAALAVAVAAPAFAGNHKSDKDLPPGLEKKLERGGELPPGWQKKVHVGEPLPDDIYDRGVVVAEDDEGLLRVRVEGKLIRLIEETHEVVEILEQNP